MKLNWEKLLCSKTLAEKEKMPSSWVDYPQDPFEQDYREITSSLSFRRLQDKAQVYQMEKGSFVRTRLTHSLEVSTIAKQLGLMMIYNDKWNKIPALNALTPDNARAIPTVLACAGLLHDLGNPPFGHEGEHCIGHWIYEHLQQDSFAFCGKPVREMLGEDLCRDLYHFDGNAQTIRILSKCRFLTAGQEANVSYATVSTLIKYPITSAKRDRDSQDARAHKFGYYVSEQDLVNQIRTATGMALPEEPLARNPLTYILEAADDIAYVASDIEDGVSKNTISIPQIVAFMEKEISKLPTEGDEMHQLQLLTVEGALSNLKSRLAECEGDESLEMEAIHKWTMYLRNWLMYVSASSFVKNADAIMDGTYTEDLLMTSHHRFTVEILKKEMKKNVYPRLSDVHLAANTVIRGLMDQFMNAVIYWDTDQKMDRILEAAIDIIPQQYKTVYFKEKQADEGYNLYLRFRMVLDFISSMTDGDALQLYKKLMAVSI